MDIIQAFEQLRIVARDPILGYANEKQHSNHDNDNDLQQVTNLDQQTSNRQKQLCDFDNSIQTLIQQIGNLDTRYQECEAHINKTSTETGLPYQLHAGSTPTNLINTTKFPNQTFSHSFSFANEKHPNTNRESQSQSAFKNSHISQVSNCLTQTNCIDTIDEEEEDSTSQQSSCSDSPADYSTVIRNLINQDLASVIDHIKRLSSTIFVGKEIESIHNKVFSLSDTAPNLNAIFNVQYVMSLLKSYDNLYSGEHLFKQLPTLNHYYFCGQKLREFLTDLNNDHLPRGNNFNSSQETINDNLSPYEPMVEDHHCQNLLMQNEQPSSNEAIDCDGNATNIDNWTVSKLYNNHNHD